MADKDHFESDAQNFLMCFLSILTSILWYAPGNKLCNLLSVSSLFIFITGKFQILISDNNLYG